jgi:hypothetical protein
MVAGGQGTTATTGYVGGGGGEVDLCRGQPQRRMVFRLLGGIRGGDQGWSLLQRQPSRGRAEGDVVGFNKSRLCNFLWSNSLLRLARGYLVARSSTILLL